MNNNDIYQKVTDNIIKKLEENIVPWSMPWGENMEFPYNGVTKKYYRGVNMFLIPFYNYTNSAFFTFKQIKDLGGNVKKGEKGHMGVFYKLIEKNKNRKENEVPEFIPLIKHFYVFNFDQC